MRISLVAALTLAAPAWTAQVKPGPLDPAEFLRKAVAEGLKEDGADRAFVKDCIADKRELFVLKCPICEPVRNGFVEHANAKEPVTGKGIPKDIVDDLKNPVRLAQLKAIERLVDRYVSRHYERLKMSADDRQKMQAEMDVRKKEGMKMKALGSPKFGDFCPSCNGAAKAK
jgi:hypothetical protein